MNITSIKQALLTQWNFIRIIRLTAGLFFAIQAMQLQDVMAGFISIILLFQSLTNTGCCGASGCAVPSTSKSLTPTQKLEYKEVKEK